MIYQVYRMNSAREKPLFMGQFDKFYKARSIVDDAVTSIRRELRIFELDEKEPESTYLHSIDFNSDGKATIVEHRCGKSTCRKYLDD